MDKNKFGKRVGEKVKDRVRGRAYNRVVVNLPGWIDRIYIPVLEKIAYMIRYRIRVRFWYRSGNEKN